MSDEQEEALREAACIGNLHDVEELLKGDIDINSTNKMNGWTALHWACKRGHASVVKKLLAAGSDKDLKTLKGETAADMTSNNEIRGILGAPLLKSKTPESPKSDGFTPNYLANPTFPYLSGDHNDERAAGEPPVKIASESAGFLYQPLKMTLTKGDQWTPSGYLVHPDFMVLRVRIGHTVKINGDFIEVEIGRHASPSLEKLVKICCSALDGEIAPEDVKSIRKLPNTLLRNDRDVQRLTDYQSLELVLNRTSHTGSVSAYPAPGNEPAELRYMKEQVSRIVY